MTEEMKGSRMGKVRVVLIGFGGMGRQYAQMLRDNEVEGMVLSGVCCRNTKGQGYCKRSFPVFQFIRV